MIGGLGHNSAVLAGLADRLARASVEPGCEQGPAVAGQRIGKVSATSWVWIIVVTFWLCEVVGVGFGQSGELKSHGLFEVSIVALWIWDVRF